MSLPIELAAVPPEQSALFADGTISLEEYQSAFSAFRQCATEAGGVVNELKRDPLTGVISYESAGELLGPGEPDGTVENVCYQRFFVQTEITFQLTDPSVLGGEADSQMQIFDRSFRPCLDHLDIAVPDDLEFNDENWTRLLDVVATAISRGDCPPSVFEA